MPKVPPAGSTSTPNPGADGSSMNAENRTERTDDRPVAPSGSAGRDDAPASGHYGRPPMQSAVAGSQPATPNHPLRLQHDRLRLDPTLLRPLTLEYASRPRHAEERPFIAHYRHNDRALLYLAAHHGTSRSSQTFSLVEELFSEPPPPDAVVIEGLAHREGRSPQWYLDEVRAEMTEEEIPHEESGCAAFWAAHYDVPFFGGEPDDAKILEGVRKLGFEPLDLLGFYLVRNVPQWRRQGKDPDERLQRGAAPLLTSYGKRFGLPPKQVPNLDEVLAWYEDRTGKSLQADEPVETFGPYADSPEFLHRLSAAVDGLRERGTLSQIEQLLNQFARVAVVYGSSHWPRLAPSFEAALGPPDTQPRA